MDNPASFLKGNITNSIITCYCSKNFCTDTLGKQLASTVQVEHKSPEWDSLAGPAHYYQLTTAKLPQPTSCSTIFFRRHVCMSLFLNVRGESPRMVLVVSIWKWYFPSKMHFQMLCETSVGGIDAHGGDGQKRWVPHRETCVHVEYFKLRRA